MITSETYNKKLRLQLRFGLLVPAKQFVGNAGFATTKRLSGKIVSYTVSNVTFNPPLYVELLPLVHTVTKTTVGTKIDDANN